MIGLFYAMDLFLTSPASAKNTTEKTALKPNQDFLSSLHDTFFPETAVFKVLSCPYIEAINICSLLAMMDV